MKTLLVVLALLLHTHSVYADRLRYYKLVNEAEMLVVNKQLPKALRLYQEAFSLKDAQTLHPSYPFSKDLLNAYFCALDVNNYSSARSNLSALLNRGINRSAIKYFIRGQYCGARLDSINKWLNTIPNDTNNNNFLHLAFKQLHDRDQKMRKYYATLYDGKYMVDSVVEMDRINAHLLYNYFFAYGVPAEDLVSSLDYNPAAGPIYSTLVTHAMGTYLSGKKMKKLDSLLFAAIFLYDYNPNDFVQLLNRLERVPGNTFKYGAYVIQLPITINCIEVEENGQVYPEHFSEDEEKRMNVQRASIGVCSLDELRKKILFSTQSRAEKSEYGKYLLMAGVGSFQLAETLRQAQPFIDKYSK